MALTLTGKMVSRKFIHLEPELTFFCFTLGNILVHQIEAVPKMTQTTMLSCWKLSATLLRHLGEIWELASQPPLHTGTCDGLTCRECWSTQTGWTLWDNLFSPRYLKFATNNFDIRWLMIYMVSGIAVIQCKSTPQGYYQTHLDTDSDSLLLAAPLSKDTQIWQR